MLFDTNQNHRNVEVKDVSGNIQPAITENIVVRLWNGEGHGEAWDGTILIEHLNFFGFADELLRKHGLKVYINGKDLLSLKEAA